MSFDGTNLRLSSNSHVVIFENGANAQEARIYGTTTGPKYCSVAHDGTISILKDFGGSGVRVSATGANLGFYGTTPIALQTGVSVTATAIKQALVNLGLMT